MVEKESVDHVIISFISDKLDFIAHQQSEPSYPSNRKSLKYTHMAWVTWFG